MMDGREPRSNSRIALLQLSDIHFAGAAPSSLSQRTRDLVSAVEPRLHGAPIVVVLSGDIAGSGKACEYEVAKRFLRLLEESFRGAGLKVLGTVMVPGNHDIDGPLDKALATVNEDLLPGELDKLSTFFGFADEFGVSFEAGLWARKRIGFDNRTVTFFLLNSAPFSSLSGFDKGKHFLPDVVLRHLKRGVNDDLLVVVSHHAPEWFEDDSLRNLERELCFQADIVLLGHEHRGPSYSEEAFGGMGYEAIRGGTISFDDEKESTFRLVLVELGDNLAGHLTVYGFAWSSSDRMFEVSLCEGREFRLKCWGIMPGKDFLDKLLSNGGERPGYLEAEFSFPKLRVGITSSGDDNEGFAIKEDIADISGLLSLISEGRSCVALCGGTGSGKSSLLRALCLECLKAGRVPVFVDSENATRSLPRSYETIAREQYGVSRGGEEAFARVPRENKVLIVDDFDEINFRHGKWNALQSMLDKVGIIVFSCKKSIGGKWEERVLPVAELTICPLTKVSRDALIQKRCDVLGLDSEYSSKLISTVDRAVMAHSGLFELTPDFVLQYVNYYTGDSGKLLSQEELPFDEILSHNAFELLRGPCGEMGGSSSLDVRVRRAMALLEGLALRLHERRSGAIKRAEISSYIRDWSKEYGVPIIPRDMLGVFESSGILKEEDDASTCRFANRRLHALFVARGINAKLDEDETAAWPLVERLLDEIQYPINEEVLLLLAHLRGTPRFVRELASRSQKCVGGFSALNLSGYGTHPIFGGLPGIKFNAPDGNTRRNSSLATDGVEEEMGAGEQFEYLDLYAYDPNAEKSEFERALIALRYLEIASGCLVKQETKLRAGDKDGVRDAVVDGCGRALGQIVEELDSKSGDIVKILVERSGDITTTKMGEEPAMRFASLMALAICIAPVDSIAAKSSERDSALALAKKCDDSSSAKLLKALLLLHSGEKERFVDFVTEWARASARGKSFVERALVAVLAGQFMLDNPRLSQSQRDRLINEVFASDGDVKKAKATLLKGSIGQPVAE